MSLADAGQILVSDAAYQTLNVREQYMDGWGHFKAVVKHGTQLHVYQFRVAMVPGLNADVPEVFRDRESIEDSLDECLRNNSSASGQVHCILKAVQEWQAEVENRVYSLAQKIGADQQSLLEKAQRAWTKYVKPSCYSRKNFTRKCVEQCGG